MTENLLETVESKTVQRISVELTVGCKTAKKSHPLGVLFFINSTAARSGLFLTIDFNSKADK